MKIDFTILFLLIVLFLSGCSSAKIKNAWKQEEYNKKTTSILVVGVAIRKGRRQLFETTLAKKLKAHGVRAIPSYTAFSKDEMKEPDVNAFLKEKNIQSVVVVKVINSKAIKQRVAQTTYVEKTPPLRMNPYFARFDGRGWHADYRYWETTISTYDTDYVISNLEANFYQQGDKNVLWSALVEIDGLDNDKSNVDDLANALVKQMRKDRRI
ncbi:hypothetical protein SAMN02745165_02770 [Malonomonas rubra DSM 5091]|uniref:Lipoprotein n=1 Tax=Malonomonas rubra DSM 5091 TaxID=1122189 RepID=A0A1M6KRB4_MALRU|nr:hypothetical protein [Malonomonas rubra]SHJ61487.1 hypothetical protein SAMN02745165_02770 [Malonomonas rubra DSM 5091]